MPASDSPRTTAVFLFSDIEGSTRMWESAPDAMSVALARHDDLMRRAVLAAGGEVFKTVGDAFCCVFGSASAAVDAALEAQQRLGAEAWPEGATIRVRMSIHAGEVELRDGDYFGPVLNRTARLLAAGHGGQVLLSRAVVELCQDGLPPSAGLRALGEHRLKDLARSEPVAQLTHPRLVDEFPALRTLDSLPNNLPRQTTTFVGREAELLTAKEMLAKTPLLTLMGSGGVGKTRLSLQVAADLLESYPDGVWSVELAPITTGSEVVDTVLSAIGIRESDGQNGLDLLAESLAAKQMLILLDNCEHVLEPAARLADRLLRSCPKVRILATSREALSVPGEAVYRVPSLGVPDQRAKYSVESLSAFEAVRLFIDRTVQVRPDFAVTNKNAPAVASVCARLDGIPLAIELAAARLRSMSVEELEQRIDQRFRILTGGPRTNLPRQQTLRAVIDWSYDLLGEDERTVLARLSVFSGGWTLEAAEYLAIGSGIDDWQMLDLLTQLVDKSLVVAGENAAVTRYRLLETVKAYAAERLEDVGETLAARLRHRDYFVEYAERHRILPQGPEFAAEAAAIAAELDNIYAVLDWELAEPEIASASIRITAAIGSYWHWAGALRRGAEICESVLDRPWPADVGRRGEMWTLLHAGRGAYRQGRRADARNLLERAHAIASETGAEDVKVVAADAVGLIVWSQCEFDLARTYFEGAAAANRASGDEVALALNLIHLGLVSHDIAQYAEAIACYDEAIEILNRLGRFTTVAIALLNKAACSLWSGDLALARKALSEGWPHVHGSHRTLSEIFYLGIEGHLLTLEGDRIAAREKIERSLRMATEYEAPEIIGEFSIVAAVLEQAEDAFVAAARHIAVAVEVNRRSDRSPQQLAQAMEQLAIIAGRLGEDEWSARVWGGLEKIHADLGTRTHNIHRERCATERAALVARLGGPRFDRLASEGAASPHAVAAEAASVVTALEPAF